MGVQQLFFPKHRRHFFFKVRFWSTGTGMYSDRNHLKMKQKNTFHISKSHHEYAKQHWTNQLTNTSWILTTPLFACFLSEGFAYSLCQYGTHVKPCWPNTPNRSFFKYYLTSFQILKFLSISLSFKIYLLAFIKN